MKKRIISIFIIMVLLLSSTSITAQTELQGNGTQISPFIANDETTLCMIADFPDACWKISNDIQLTSDWEPISEFSGILDGNGYTVSGISISNSMGYYPNETAFFKVNRGTIKNLMLDSVVDYSSSHLGGAMFVYENYGTVSGCSVSGTASLHLSNAYSQSGSQFGGFVSLNYSGGVVENCYSRISIKGTYSGGSLNYLANSVGFINTNKEGGTIRNCYSASSKASGQMSQTIKAAFCSSNSGSIESCFYDKELCGYVDEYDTHGLPKSTAAMKMQQTYTGWDFNSVWALDKNINDGYPYLQAVTADAPPANYPYEINELTIKSESGEILDKAPTNLGFIINTKFTKIKERDSEDYIFVAVYDTDGVLLNIDYIQSNLVENHTYSVGFYVPKQEKAVESVKAFIWDGFNSTTPLAETKLLTLADGK